MKRGNLALSAVGRRNHAARGGCNGRRSWQETTLIGASEASVMQPALGDTIDQDQFVGSPHDVNSASAEPLKQGKMNNPQGGPRYDTEIRLTRAHFWHGRWHVHPDERRNG
jgi:hypothetical protein